MIRRLNVAVWIALIFIFAGAMLVFFASLAPGAASVAETHGFLGFTVGFTAGILWLTEFQPSWLYFGVAFGSAAGLIDPSNWIMGSVGLLLLAIARGIQVRLKL